MNKLTPAQNKVIKVLTRELPAREAFATIKWIGALPQSHWFYRPSALKDAYAAAGSLSFEFRQAAQPCDHPAQRQFTWTVDDPQSGATVLCVGCTACGTILSGAVDSQGEPTGPQLTIGEGKGK